MKARKRIEDITMDNQHPSGVSDDSEGSETTETFSSEKGVSLDGKKFRLGAHRWALTHKI